MIDTAHTRSVTLEPHDSAAIGSAAAEPAAQPAGPQGPRSKTAPAPETPWTPDTRLCSWKSSARLSSRAFVIVLVRVGWLTGWAVRHAGDGAPSSTRFAADSDAVEDPMAH